MCCLQVLIKICPIKECLIKIPFVTFIKRGRLWYWDPFFTPSLLNLREIEVEVNIRESLVIKELTEEIKVYLTYKMAKAAAQRHQAKEWSQRWLWRFLSFMEMTRKTCSISRRWFEDSKILPTQHVRQLSQRTSCRHLGGHGILLRKQNQLGKC
jgi:hypothetical protein